MTLSHALLVAVCGTLAGAINAAAGGGTLISFPALLATGMAPVAANITSSVGLASGYIGGSVGYRAELRGQGGRALSLGITTVLGGLAGAVILLVAPAKSFKLVVPYLVLSSSLLLLVQPRLAARVTRRRMAVVAGQCEITLPLQLGVFISSVYGSYFGAGLGVLLLGVLGILINDDLQRLNGLKSLLSFIAKIVGVLVFVASGRVDWPFALILLVTAYAGGLWGARISRRLSPRVLRHAVVLLGVAVAVGLIVKG